MRTIDADHAAIIGTGRTDRRVDVRVRIEDGDGTLQDMRDFKGRDWIISAVWGEDIDTESMNCTVELIREMYNDSLSPLHETSRLNLNAGGTYDRLIDLGRRIQIQTRYAPADERAEALAWMTMFDGYIDIINWSTEVLRIDARDKYRALQDTFIEDRTEYSNSTGVAIETVLQDIVDDWIASPPTLYTPSSPLWNIKNFNAQRQSVADQINLLVDQIGWRCRYKWDSGTSAFRLTLYEPDRAGGGGPVYDFYQDDYYEIPLMEISTKDIRNAVTIKYPDPADLRQDGSPKQKSTTRTDATSIAAYGRRWMCISEEASSNIDTAGEAQDFADIILNDLAYPKIAKRVSMPYFAFVELDDLYDFAANNIHATSSLSLAVVGYRHRLSDGECTTELDLHETAAIGRHTSWFLSGGGPGMGYPVLTQEPLTIANLAVLEGNVGLTVTWESAHTATIDGYMSSKRSADTIYEVYVTAAGGSPVAGDLVGVTASNSFLINSNESGIPTGILLDVHVRAVSSSTTGSYTSVTNRRALPLGNACIAGEAQLDGADVGMNSNNGDSGENPPDGMSMEAGTWGVDAELDDGSLGPPPVNGGHYVYF